MDTVKVNQTASDVVGLLYNDHRPVRVRYEPGNGTRYELCFVNQEWCWNADPNFSVEDSSYFLVAWKGQGAWPIRLDTFVSVQYIEEKFNCNEGDALALAALFQALRKELTLLLT